MVLIDHHYSQPYFAVLKFFSSWNGCCCFDGLLLHSSMGLQNVVDTRETEVFCRKRGEYDRTTLLSYLVGDTVDRVDLGNIKGGSLFYA